MKNNTNCIETIFAKLSEGLQENNTVDLRTTGKALHVNEVMVSKHLKGKWTFLKKSFFFVDFVDSIFDYLKVCYLLKLFKLKMPCKILLKI